MSETTNFDHWIDSPSAALEFIKHYIIMNEATQDTHKEDIDHAIKLLDRHINTI